MTEVIGYHLYRSPPNSWFKELMMIMMVMFKCVSDINTGVCHYCDKSLSFYFIVM